MQDILARINRIDGVRGTLIVGEDGLVVAADFRGDEDAHALGAMASSILNTIGQGMKRLQKGELDRFIINGSSGGVVINKVGHAILLTLLRKDVNMGMVLVELKESAMELTEQLGFA